MNIFLLNEFKNGWFIGDFLPSIFRTELFEIACKKYKSGQIEKKHYHGIAIEYTLIVTGTAKINDIIINEGEIIAIYPNEIVEFSAISDITTIVIKLPSVPNDKYIVQ